VVLTIINCQLTARRPAAPTLDGVTWNSADWHLIPGGFHRGNPSRIHAAKFAERMISGSPI
jgi:hypothetical protein